MNAAKKENGVVMVEFALVLPLLLLLLVGTMWFGLALNYWIDETHLTREAARYAAVDYNPGPEGTLQAAIQAQADTAALKDGFGSTVTGPAVVCINYLANPNNGGSVGQVGDPVEATMAVTYNFIPFLSDGVSGLFGGIGIDDIVIRSTATMRLEAVPNDVVAGCSS